MKPAFYSTSNGYNYTTEISAFIRTRLLLYE